MELIFECFVKPTHEIEASKSRIYLNPIEACMLRNDPTQQGVLYTLPRPTSCTLIDLLDKLKCALSVTLTHFYSLSGQLVAETFVAEHACAVFIDCRKGLGAKLTHVVAVDVAVSDIVSPVHVPPIVSKFFDLGEIYSDYEGQTRPLLSIQVTELVDGVFIGFTINHCVADGISFMHFVSVLSEIFCSNITSVTPLGFSSGPPIYEDCPLVKLPYLGLENFPARSEYGRMIDRVFHFSSKSLALIKAKAQEGSVPTVSTFQGLVSLIWRSITKARNISTEEETTCNFAINARPRVDPPKSDQYFGNHVSHVKLTCKVGELLAHDLGWAATRLNEEINVQDDKYIRGYLNSVADLVSTPGFLMGNSFLKANSVMISGSTRFDMFGLEFGLGKAIATLMGPGNKYDGKVNASQGCETGSVDLEISLKHETMAALEADHDFVTFVTFKST